MTRRLLAVLALTAACVTTAAAAGQPTPLVDRFVPGDAASESAHRFLSDRSEPAKGALDQPGRRLLPPAGDGWEGGRFAFVMKVDPDRPNYLTARFWGGEANPNFLVLFCEGKQVGYRHLGDVDVLATPDDEPRYPGRFYYVTTPLPRAMTKGKTEVSLEVRASGPTWAYATKFEQYQKPMTRPSRVVYALATHTDGCFVPPAVDVQGEPPKATPRDGPGPEVMDEAKKRVNDNLARMLKSAKPLNQMELQFLARAYRVKWSAAFGQKAAVEQVVKGVDALHRRFKADPNELWADKATWNPDWFGVGPAGDAVRLLAAERAPRLDEKLDERLDGDVTRRAAWSAMFRGSRDWLRAHQRWLANQAMFTATNLYLSDRAVAAIDPPNALPAGKALDYLHRAAGLAPFLGAEGEAGPDKPFGSSFYQVTKKGLSRELGYVGGYGEVGVAGVAEMYEATRPAGGGEDDPALKAQLAKAARARAAFRYPAPDDDGHAAMRMETAVGWRDTHFPGPVLYTQPAGGEHSILGQAAATLDPHVVGAAQQMIGDRQFFATVARHLANRSFRATIGLLSLPDDYDAVRAQPPSPHRLPMTPGGPDYVWADEEAGVVAVRRGDEILYASLYWRSRGGINGLARVHRLLPTYQQVAVVYEDVTFEPSGRTWKRPNWTNFGFGTGGFKYPGNPQSALAGEELPIPVMPPDVPAEGKKDNPYAGRADFYRLRFGPYLIAMNTTADKTFELAPPAGVKRVTDVATGKAVDVSGPVKVGPLSTVAWVVE